DPDTNKAVLSATCRVGSSAASTHTRDGKRASRDRMDEKSRVLCDETRLLRCSTEASWL
ncbi:11611_t:CDS:1, partial [Acaulospora colombiana]